MSTTTILKPVTNSYQISDSLFLVNQSISDPASSTPVAVATNHVFLIDCSGSMSYDLPQIRQHVKNKFPTLVKDGDTVTLGWFSGKGEFGIFQEEIEVRSLTDLSALNTAVDRFFRPMGLTGFKEPLMSVAEAIQRIKQNRPNTAFSFVFQTDGQDNVWDRASILQACRELTPLVSVATIVEYGYYCNHSLLVEMAETLGGSLICAKDFSQYTPVVEKALSSVNQGGGKVKVKPQSVPKYGFVFTLKTDFVYQPVSNEMLTYGVENGEVLLPSDVESIWYFTDLFYESASTFPNQLTNFVSTYDRLYANVSSDKYAGWEKMKVEASTLFAAYAGTYLLAQRSKSKEVYEMLFSLGDKHLLDLYSNALGKQRQLHFQGYILDVLQGKESVYKQGFDSALVMPPADAYCVMNLIQDLTNTEGVYWYPKHPDFKYNRIGARRVPTASLLTNKDKERLSALSTLLCAPNISLDDFKELMEELRAIEDKKKPLEFKTDEPNPWCYFTKLVWNADRPNLSVEVTYRGSVTVPANSYDITHHTTYRGYVTVPANSYGITHHTHHMLPNVVPCNQTRAYTFIKDGILNVETLVVRLPKDLLDKLTKEIGYAITPDTGYYADVYHIDLTNLPIINREMIKEISAKTAFETEYGILKAEAEMKVLKAYEATLSTATSKHPALTEYYGAECAEWLTDLGFTDYSFSPNMAELKSGDNYMATKLRFKIAGASALPSVKDVKEKIVGGKKLNTADLLMRNSMDELDVAMAGRSSEWSGDYINTRREALKPVLKAMQTAQAMTKFAIILGQVWFNDLSEDGKMTLTIDGAEVKFEAVLEDKPVDL